MGIVRLLSRLTIQSAQCRRYMTLLGKLDPYQSSYKTVCYGQLVYVLDFFWICLLASQWCGHLGGRIETWSR